MDKISAVICELNPLHEGHKYILSKAKEHGDTVIAIMSGNFVQRGEAAVYDKYRRAESALEAGADLVVELPFPWSAASAEFFAAAGVEIAEKLGAENLVFGSECGEIDVLNKASEITKKAEFLEIPANIRAAKYREDLLYKYDNSLPNGLLSSANDILGIEYIKNLKAAVPIPCKRISCHRASSIRADMKDNHELYADAVFSDKLFDLAFYKYRLNSDSKEYITAESKGGVGERLAKSAFVSKNGVEMLEKAKTKQYTDARLRRAALFFLTEVYMNDLKELPLYTILLGANDKGREYLSNIRKEDKISIITKPSDESNLSDEAKRQYRIEKRADSLYTLLMNETESGDYFIKKSPIIK